MGRHLLPFRDNKRVRSVLSLSSILDETYLKTNTHALILSTVVSVCFCVYRHLHS